MTQKEQVEQIRNKMNRKQRREFDRKLARRLKKVGK